VNDPSRVRVIVEGHVQGVFFRASCAKLARRLGVSGWVRNRADGAVEAEFEGPGDAVDAIVAWCRRGPPSARVDGVTVEAVPRTGEDGFAVTR
jgi:acylphosphatase